MMKQIFIAAVFLLMLTPPARAELSAAGRVLSAVTGISRVDLTLEGGAAARVEVLGNDTVRVRVAPSGVFSTQVTGAVVGQPAGSAAVFDTADATYLVAPGVSVVVQKQPYRIAIFRSDGSLVQADLEPAVAWDIGSGAIFTRKWSPPDERYYGMGERGGPLNRRGRRLAMRNVDWFGAPPLADVLYISIPYYWGMRGTDAYGVYLDTGATSFFHFDPDAQGEVTYGSVNGELDYYVFAGSKPKDVSRQYGEITGFSTLPPRWTLGYHQSRYGYASQAEFLAIAQELRRQQLPTDVLYFDIDYLDNLQLFTWNGATFPDPVAMNATLKSLGFHTVNIMEPVVATADRLYPYLAGSDFLVDGPGGNPLVNLIWYGWVSWLDFTKPEAAQWYGKTLQSFMSLGIDGVWNDLNEPAQNYMDEAIYDFAGERRTDAQARNLYALREAIVSYDAMKTLRPTVRPWGISRSGFAGIQRYLANWGGDALSDWETLRANLQTSLSMALSGQNFFGHDIGGFLGAPDAELFTRWMEFSAFTPLFRNHAMNTSPAREPWAFGEPTLTYVREIINERYRLLPFLYTLFERASRNGEPSIAPTVYYFPSDQNTWNDDTSFMVGESMLVAPVLTPGVTSRNVYLPGEGLWFDIHSGIPMAAGQTHEVAAPLGSIPTFVQAGAIIPKGPVMQYTGERPLTEVHLHLFPGPASSFTLYEDDGSSFDYRQGAYLRTRIQRSDDGTASTCVIERVEGNMTPLQGRSWYLEFRDVPDFALVFVGGTLLESLSSETVLTTADTGWARAADGHIIVKVPDQADPISVEVYRANWNFF